MGEVIWWFIYATFSGLLAVVIVCCLMVQFLPPEPILERIREGKPRIPAPQRAAIAEMTAHKLAHNTWVEGQRLAMEWWEQECQCPPEKELSEVMSDLRFMNERVRSGRGGKQAMEALVYLGAEAARLQGLRERDRTAERMH